MTQPIHGSDPCSSARQIRPDLRARTARGQETGAGEAAGAARPAGPPPDGLEAGASGRLREAVRASGEPPAMDAARLERGREHVKSGYFHTDEGIEALAQRMLEPQEE